MIWAPRSVRRVLLRGPDSARRIAAMISARTDAKRVPERPLWPGFPLGRRSICCPARKAFHSFFSVRVGANCRRKDSGSPLTRRTGESCIIGPLDDHYGRWPLLGRPRQCPATAPAVLPTAGPRTSMIPRPEDLGKVRGQPDQGSASGNVPAVRAENARRVVNRHLL